MSVASSNAEQINQAVQVLIDGGLVAFPTETVYGLGADASSRQAIEGIYQAKGRPTDHPVIVHVAAATALRDWCCDIPEQAWVLARAFWPGPLTMILKRHPDVDAAVSGGQDTIGVRCPSHPVAQRLLRAFEQHKAQLGAERSGVAAPSANRFGRVSPTQAEHVRQEFPDLVAKGMPVLEGGDSEVGIESTIVDLSSLDRDASVTLLRPGAISATDLSRALGLTVSSGQRSNSPRVSGSLKAHYAPATPITLCDSASLVGLAQAWLQDHPGRLAVMAYQDVALSDPRLSVMVMPRDAKSYAHRLYAALRQLDDLDVQIVLCEQVPQTQAWAGVNDRLSRAAAAFDGSPNTPTSMSVD